MSKNTTLIVAAAMATISLDVAIERGETRIATVQLRKPGPGELRGLKLVDIVSADADAMIVLIPRVSMPPLTEAEVAGMDLSDFLECANQIAGFLPQRGARADSPSA